MPNQTPWNDDYEWSDDYTWNGEYDSSQTKQPSRPSSLRSTQEARSSINASDRQVKSKSWDKWATTPTPTQARAMLGNQNVKLTFPFNPDTVAWDYSENVASQDTLGGRIVQLLSTSLNGMTVEGRAGSRRELQRMAIKFKEIMNYHIKTLEPVEFKVPSRNWNFRVYLQAVPQLSWDIASTSYPYQLQLLVEEDLTGIKTHQINSEALKRLASGLGYDYNMDIHGGNAQLLQRTHELMQANYESLRPSGGQSSGTTTDSTLGGTQPESCSGKGCTVTAFMTALARYVGANPTPEIMTVLVNWAAEEGGSVNNSYDYNLCNTGWTKGVKVTNNSGSFPAYASFQDGVEAHGKTLQQNGYGYEGIIKAMKSGDSRGLAEAINSSKWCATNCYGKNGSDLLRNHGSYGKNVLP